MGNQECKGGTKTMSHPPKKKAVVVVLRPNIWRNSCPTQRCNRPENVKLQNQQMKPTRLGLGYDTSVWTFSFSMFKVGG